jgi:hypothetical protein
MKKIFLATITVFIISAISGCEDDGKKGWSEVVRKCAVSDLIPEKIMYFGPSLNVGPGTVWRKAENNSYRLRWTLDSMPTHSNDFLQTGAKFDCKGASSTKFEADSSIGFSSNLSKVSGNIAADFKEATDIEVKASQLQWDLVIEGPYEQFVKSLPPKNGGFRTDLEKGGKLVLYRALKVTGYEATLTFDSQTGTSIKGKYSDTITSTNFSPSLNLAWSGNTELKITSKEDFYIAGELVSYSSSGFSSSNGGVFGNTVDIIENYNVEVEQ